MSGFERVALRVLFDGLRTVLCDEWNDVKVIGSNLRPGPCRIKMKWRLIHDPPSD